MAIENQTERRMSLSAFLSHSYKAPAVNQFFYELTTRFADITFRVDRGTFRTSTTRLERMVRDADAFIGVWPLSSAVDVSLNREALKSESKYFRLELDMAIRAHKPTIIFSDRRYANLLQAPPGATQLHYDMQEVQLFSAAPSWRKLERQTEAFWEAVGSYTTAQPQSRTVEDGRVGVFMASYEDVDASNVACETVRDLGCEPVNLRPQLSLTCLRELERCDWVIADVTDPAVGAITAYLHGRFVPLLRVRRSTGQDVSSMLEQTLFGDLSVGYRKDVTAWATEDDLRQGLSERLGVVNQQSELIADQNAAMAYFNSAAKRKEAVFLSYSGDDADWGAQFATELHHRFQEVFDYRDGKSIPVGEHWQDRIISQLSSTAVGVILFSHSYAKSGNCMDEARRLYDSFLNANLKLLSVKLDDSPAPKLLSGVQYDRISGSSPGEIVKNFVTEQLS
jgi:TIR domain